MSQQRLKYSVKIKGRSTSCAIETPYLEGLRAMARAAETSVEATINQIDDGRRAAGHTNLSSAIRLAVLEYYVARVRAQEKNDGQVQI